MKHDANQLIIIDPGNVLTWFACFLVLYQLIFALANSLIARFLHVIAVCAIYAF